MIALSGENSRKVFFDDKSLDASQGYRILMGGAPNLECIDVGKVETARQEFIKDLLLLLRKDRLVDSSSIMSSSIFCTESSCYFRSLPCSP